MNSAEQAHRSLKTGVARVIVYTRVGCYLCGDAEELVARVCKELDQTFDLIDVDQDPALVAQFSDYVPVVEVDGVQQGFWRIDEDRLRAALTT